MSARQEVIIQRILWATHRFNKFKVKEFIIQGKDLF